MFDKCRGKGAPGKGPASIFGPHFGTHFPSKIYVKIDAKIDDEKVTEIDEKVTRT